jgi:hypothetical protein
MMNGRRPSNLTRSTCVPEVSTPFATQLTQHAGAQARFVEQLSGAA